MSRSWFFARGHAWHAISGLRQLVELGPIGAKRRARKRSFVLGGAR